MNKKSHHKLMAFFIHKHIQRKDCYRHAFKKRLLLF